MEKSTITSKGQTTIPAGIRTFLGLKPGDELDYVKTKAGTVEIAPRKRYTWRDLRGALPKPKKAMTVEAMNQAVLDAVAAKYKRSFPRKGKGKKA